LISFSLAVDFSPRAVKLEEREKQHLSFRISIPIKIIQIIIIEKIASLVILIVMIL
jgi:hypothetical protein